MLCFDIPTSKTFLEIFPSEVDFTNGFPSNYAEYMKGQDGTQIVPFDILYLLLVSKYGESHIASEEATFKNRLYAIVFQYGPTWARNLDIQNQLRQLSDNQLITGTTQINNHAYNPSTVIEDGPNPDSGEIETVNEQTKTKYKKSYMEAYANLMSLLERDVTEEFLNRFKRLFKVIIGCKMCKESDEYEEGE